MNQAVETIGSILFIILFFVMSYLYFSSRIKYLNLISEFTRTQIEKEFFKEKLTEYVSQKENKKVEQTEGFVRFISQSREAAFEYIESVQKDIAELKDYFDKNGLNFTVEQAEEMAKRIENVINHLPEETNND